MSIAVDIYFEVNGKQSAKWQDFAKYKSVTATPSLGERQCDVYWNFYLLPKYEVFEIREYMTVSDGVGNLSSVPIGAPRVHQWSNLGRNTWTAGLGEKIQSITIIFILKEIVDPYKKRVKFKFAYGDDGNIEIDKELVCTDFSFNATETGVSWTLNTNQYFQVSEIRESAYLRRPDESSYLWYEIYRKPTTGWNVHQPGTTSISYENEIDEVVVTFVLKFVGKPKGVQYEFELDGAPKGENWSEFATEFEHSFAQPKCNELDANWNLHLKTIYELLGYWVDEVRVWRKIVDLHTLQEQREPKESYYLTNYGHREYIIETSPSGTCISEYHVIFSVKTPTVGEGKIMVWHGAVMIDPDSRNPIRG